MAKRAQASYDAYIVNIPLREQDSIGSRRFLATVQNYQEKLCGHRSVQDGLRALLIELFKCGAIVQCRIMHGTQMQLQLSRRNSESRRPLQTALQQFLAVLQELTATHLSMAPGGTNNNQLSRWRPEHTCIVRGLVGVVDLVCDGLVVVTGIN